MVRSLVFGNISNWSIIEIYEKFVPQFPGIFAKKGQAKMNVETGGEISPSDLHEVFIVPAMRHFGLF